MKIVRTIGLWILLAGSTHASSWSDLWYRRDQQGQQALQAGDSKGAAELFTDPRRQAFAQLKAEQYAAAAKRLAPFTDGASQYNRGNALAKSGDLHAALDAYDGALKHPDLESSLRRDAQHNRDLVARQLQTQKDQKSPSSGGQSTSKDQQNGKPQGSDAKDAPSASDSSKPPATAASESPSQGEKSKPAGSEPSATTPTSPSQKSPSQKSPGDRQRPADQRPQSTDDRNASTQHQPQEQAVGQQAPGSASRGDEKQLTSRGAAIGDSSLPRTEQQLALEQWLRQIPDDPGGLLRRKFMIEHLMKQQQVQP